MSDFFRVIDSIVDESDWHRMAKTAEMHPRELKDRILRELDRTGPRGVRDGDREVTWIDAEAPDGCLRRKFEISLFKAIGLSVDFTLCGRSASHWRADVELCLIVAGACVMKRTFVLDPNHIGSCLKYDVGLVRADLCFELDIKSNKVCPRIHGRVGLWWPFSWHYKNLDITPFCVPLP